MKCGLNIFALRRNYFFSFVISAFSLIIAELPVGSSRMIFCSWRPHMMLVIFLSMFFAFFLSALSSAPFLAVSTCAFTRSKMPSMLVMKPFAAGPGVIVVTCGILMVASDDLMTRTFMSSSLVILKVNFEGSFASSASISDL